jgi:hypothetical protein
LAFLGGFALPFLEPRIALRPVLTERLAYPLAVS